MIVAVNLAAKAFAQTSTQPAAYPTLHGERPIVIGHRGASGYRPEHTLASYELAIEQGADFIEPDLVITKDGALVCRHENDISGTTDVADKPQFASRHTTKTIDGKSVTGWFAEDFTLAELKTLRARERLEFRDRSFDGRFEVPTLDEVIDLAKRRSKDTGRTIGIYPETKHPSYFRAIGLPLEEPLLAALKKAGWDAADAPVFIQSFEVGNLKQLRKQTKVRLIQLIEEAAECPADFVLAGDQRTYGDLITPKGLAEIATYADGIGPFKRLIVPTEPLQRDAAGKAKDASGDGVVSDADMKCTKPTPLIANAHAAGLLVHPYTFRSDARYVASDYAGDASKEYAQFYAMGVDGLFSDFPDQAVKARETTKARR